MDQTEEPMRAQNKEKNLGHVRDAVIIAPGHSSSLSSAAGRRLCTLPKDSLSRIYSRDFTVCGVRFNVEKFNTQGRPWNFVSNTLLLAQGSYQCGVKETIKLFDTGCPRRRSACVLGQNNDGRRGQGWWTIGWEELDSGMDCLETSRVHKRELHMDTSAASQRHSQQDWLPPGWVLWQNARHPPIRLEGKAVWYNTIFIVSTFILQTSIFTYLTLELARRRSYWLPKK